MPAEGTFTVVMDPEEVIGGVGESGRLTVKFQGGVDYALFGGDELRVLDKFSRTGTQATAVQKDYELELPTDVPSDGVPEDSLVGYDLTWFTQDARVSTLFFARPAGATVLLSDLLNPETIPLAQSTANADRAEAAADAAEASAAAIADAAEAIAGLTGEDSAVAALLNDETSDVYEAVSAGFMRGQVVTHPRWGAVGDGTTDDHAAIQACLTAVGAAGGGVVALPERTFRINTYTSLTIPSNVTLAGAGNESVLDFTYASNTDPLHLITNADRTGGNSNIEVRDLTIKGASPGGPTGVPSSPGVTLLFQRVDKVNVTNVTFYRTRGPAVHFQGCTQVRAGYNKIEDCGRGGIVALSLPSRPLKDVLIVGNEVVGVGDDGIAISNTAASSALAENVAITGNTVDGVNIAAVFENDPDDGGRGILVIGVNGCAIVGNAIGNTASRSIAIREHRGTGERSKNVTISGNTGLRPGPIGTPQSNQGMLIRQTDHVVLGPTVIDGAGAHGLYIDDCTHVTGGPINVHGCGDTIGHAGVSINGVNTTDIDLQVDAYLNAGPGVIVTDATRVMLRGRALNNAVAGSGSGATSAGVLLKTAGEVSLMGWRSLDTRATKLQTYGLACTTASPSRLTMIGGDYSGNLLGGFQFTTTPTQLVKRGVVESTTASANFDQDATGQRVSPPIWANLTSDVTVTNSTTMVDAVATSQALASNATYEIVGVVDYSADAAADVQFGWKSADLPGASLAANFGGLQTTTSTTQGQILRNRNTLSATTTIGAIGTGLHIMAPVRGKIVTSNTGAALTLQFAQGTAHASAAVLYAGGTYLKLVRIA